MKRVLMLAAVALTLVTAGQAHACGGCGGGFGWLAGGSCRPKPISQANAAVAVHLASASLATTYLTTNHATWSWAAEGLEHVLVGLTSR